MALTSEQVLGLVARVENATDADKRLAAIQLLEATLDGAQEIPDVDAVIQVLKVSIKNANQAVSAAALAFLPSLFTSLAAPVVTHGRILPSSVAHVRAAIINLMPTLIEKLGDQKERVREASRKALTQLGSCAFTVSPSADAAAVAGVRKGKDPESPLMIFERFMRDNALGAKAARIKEQATQVLPALKVATQDRFPVRLLLPSLVTLLSDADPSVREGSRIALVALFVHSTPAAKAGLKKELERQDVRKATMDAIIKEVLAGPSAASQVETVSVALPSNGSAPARSAQAGVAPAVGGGGLTGPAPVGADDNVPPVYVASKSDLDRTFSQMMPFFEGRETEHNWLSREQSVLKVRGLLKTNTHITYRAAFIEGVKHVHEGILKVLASLRTSMAVHACSLLSELARAVGDGLDTLADTFLSALLRMAGLTKKIVAAASQAAARDFLIYVPFKHAFATMLSNTLQEKTITSRQAAIEHICTVLQYQGSHRRHALESHGGQALFDQALKRALADQNKDVRAKARQTFWVYQAIWPAQATSILDTVDAATKRAILAEVPAPGTTLLLTADKPSGRATVQQNAGAVPPTAAQNPVAPAPVVKQPLPLHRIGSVASDLQSGIAPKSRSTASTTSTVTSTDSAPVSASASAPGTAPAKRRIVGPSAALLAAKREATLKMRAAEQAAGRVGEDEGSGGDSFGRDSRDVGDDSEGGDWMADFQSSNGKTSSVSTPAQPAFMPSRQPLPAFSSTPSAPPLPPPAPRSPPRFVPKYGHDAILASPPRHSAHARSISSASIGEASPTRIPLPVSPTSPRMSDQGSILGSPRLGHRSGLVSDKSRLPRPSTDLLALAGNEDADETHLLSMPGPDASIDLMMFSSGSMDTPVRAPTSRAGTHGPSKLADDTAIASSSDVEELGPETSSLTISAPTPAHEVETQAVEFPEAEPSGLPADDGKQSDAAEIEQQSTFDVSDAAQSEQSYGRDVEETVALQAHEATSTATQLLNLLETPIAAAAAAAGRESTSHHGDTSTPRAPPRATDRITSPNGGIASPDTSHTSSLRGVAQAAMSPTSSSGSRSRAGTPLSAQRRSQLPRPVSMLHKGSSPLVQVKSGRHSSTRSVDLSASTDSVTSGTNGLTSQSKPASRFEDDRRSSISSTTSSRLGGGPTRQLGSRPPAAPAYELPRATFDAQPINPTDQSAAVKSFLRRAGRLEQGSPIKAKPEVTDWVEAVRTGTADLRTYKRLLKLTIEFRIDGDGGGTGGELVPGRQGPMRQGGGGGGALGLDRMGEGGLEDEEAAMRAWEEGGLFEKLFMAICASLQAPAKAEELRTACFALLHRLVENQFLIFATTGRELDLLALLFQLGKDGRKGKQTLDACEAILASWSSRTDPMIGVGAVLGNIKTTADALVAQAGGADVGGVGDESTLRTLVMGLKVLGRLLVRLPGVVIEDELTRMAGVIRMTLTHANVELRRTAIETLVAANRQINNAEALFKIVGPLPTSQQDLLMYYFHKAGQQ